GCFCAVVNLRSPFAASLSRSSTVFADTSDGKSITMLQSPSWGARIQLSCGVTCASADGGPAASHAIASSTTDSSRRPFITTPYRFVRVAAQSARPEPSSAETDACRHFHAAPSASVTGVKHVEAFAYELRFAWRGLRRLGV